MHDDIDANGDCTQPAFSNCIKRSSKPFGFIVLFGLLNNGRQVLILSLYIRGEPEV